MVRQRDIASVGAEYLVAYSYEYCNLHVPTLHATTKKNFTRLLLMQTEVFRIGKY